MTLSSNDNKRLQTFDKTTTYPYGTNALKVCESEIQRNSLKKDVDATSDIEKGFEEDGKRLLSNR